MIIYNDMKISICVHQGFLLYKAMMSTNVYWLRHKKNGPLKSLKYIGRKENRDEGTES